MTLANLRTLARSYVPAADTSIISDATQLIIFNQACVEIARFTKCLPKYSTFTAVVDRREYNLRTLITDYLCPLDEGYCYYYDGTDYDQIDLVNIGYLNLNHSDWQTESSGDTDKGVILGDTFYPSPPSDSTVSNGYKLFYCAKPTDMSAETHYPYSGSTTEISRLAPYDEVIIDYYRVRAFRNLDLGADSSARIQEAEQKLANSMNKMKAELSETQNKVIGTSRKARARVNMDRRGAYGPNPFS